MDASPDTSRQDAPLIAFPAGLDGSALLACALTGPARGAFAVVSSFGADSALLLAMVAEIDRSAPVLFLETRRHFPETLAYRDRLVRRLGLTGLRNVLPERDEARRADPDGQLWAEDPDACCALRKVRPLEQALRGFSGWITGRRREQSATRARLPTVEHDRERIKLNPLAGWDRARVESEIARRDLPRHPLVAVGYPSIGCATCTRAVAPGQDERAGRWSFSGKTECGIHLGA